MADALDRRCARRAGGRRRGRGAEAGSRRKVRDRLETLQGELRESEQTKANVAGDQVRASEKAIGEANRA
jgi:hypothetical protein